MRGTNARQGCRAAATRGGCSDTLHRANGACQPIISLLHFLLYNPNSFPPYLLPSNRKTSSTACCVDFQRIDTTSTAMAATASPPPLPSLPVPSRRLPASPASQRAPPSIAGSAAAWSSPTPCTAQTTRAAGASLSGASSAPRQTRASPKTTPCRERARTTPPPLCPRSSRLAPLQSTAAPPSPPSPSTHRRHPTPHPHKSPFPPYFFAPRFV